MTGRADEPIPQLPDWIFASAASDRFAAWSYERLAELRRTAVTMRDSEFVWQHEQVHLAEIVARIDATVNLKKERESYSARKGLPVPDTGRTGGETPVPGSHRKTMRP
jgi:hypothetical protein